MRRPILVLACGGVLSCAQLLGLDDLGDRSGGSGGVANGAGGSSSTGAGGGATSSGGGFGGTSGTGGGGGQLPSYVDKAVSGGEQHTCALLLDGRVVCWGKNSDVQLGDGTFTLSLVPVLVKNITSAI